VNPRNTTKTCSKCGNVQNIELSERTFNCKNCGMSMDRDLNAAINILSTAGHAGSYALEDLPSTSKTVDARRVVELGTTYNRI
jgi:putative transposase